MSVKYPAKHYSINMGAIEPYTQRTVEFLKERNFSNWKLKIYRLSTGDDPVTEDLVTTGLNEILPNLPQPATTEDRYGVGYVIIHRGSLRNWFSLCWWEYEDILFHKLFSSPLDNMASISAEESSAIACVHELKIVNFETEAWIETVLSENGDPDFKNYMSKTIET